ncbi:L-serine ammonia-lyase, iron-sulfur-dependent, subunit alpha, partial [Arthrobacter sp. C152]
ASRTGEEIRAGLLHIWSVMEACVQTSLKREGVLPGGLKVRRRAPGWFDRLKKECARPGDDSQGLDFADWEFHDPRYWQEWVNLVALAVNEENA